MSRDITKLLHEVGARANRAPHHQVSTLAHLLVHCLQKNGQYVQEASQPGRPIHDAISELEANLERYAPLSEENREAVAGNRRVADYVFDDVKANYANFYQQRQEPGTLTDSVLLWLLESDVDNRWLTLARKVCLKHHVDGLYLFADESSTQVHELGFGLEIRADSLFGPLLGRDIDLERHLGFLSLAVKQRRHYLLEGQRGVGKSEFVRRLLALALQQWHNASDPALRNARFLYFNQDNFIGSEEHNRLQLEKLYSYLRHNANVFPVFDSLEAILNPHLAIQEAFTDLFGAILAVGGRTFVLVSRSGLDTQSNLLRNTNSVTLPPLSTPVTRSIVEARMAQLLDRVDIPLAIGESQEFYNQLVNLAKDRYPGRFFPDIALHLAESVVNRAENRITYMEKEPFDRITLGDLWEHVAEEQSVGVELLGKNPDEFYTSVQARIKENHVAQDHAIDQVCGVLRLMATRVRRQPRGRFLFAGPPGTGKTYLGRQLALQLGLGEEAFFVFNMSEYSSEGSRTRFMGADPGYVGFGTSKTIYDVVRSRPSCVIVLDEIDRADASIQDILLSILEGEGKDAQGDLVYFSQVIFIMTTNQGQEQVIEAYRGVERNDLTRSELVERFSDEALRTLILQGVVDETEMAMRHHLRRETENVKAAFDGWHQGSDPAQQEGDMLIEHYVDLRNRAARLEQVQRKTPLDRALLDRVDFVIPFFPIKEPEHLDAILDLSLSRYDWTDCPDNTRRTILEEALKEDQSARSIERLVIKYLESATQH